MQSHLECVLTESVLCAYETAVAAIGSVQFQAAAVSAVNGLAHVDRCYVFDIPTETKKLRPLIQFHEPEKPPVTSLTYARHYLPHDPVWLAISRATSDTPLQVRCAPGDIVVDDYRRMLERSDIVDRVSYLRPIASGWRCMTVSRRRESGVFDAEEVATLSKFASLLMPAVNRHEALSMHTSHDVSELEKRFARRFPELTRRERQICARGAIGMTVADAARDLGLAISSIHTFRKRAYYRLGVSSVYELARLVMR